MRLVPRAACGVQVLRRDAVLRGAVLCWSRSRRSRGTLHAACMPVARSGTSCLAPVHVSFARVLSLSTPPPPPVSPRPLLRFAWSFVLASGGRGWRWRRRRLGWSFGGRRTATHARTLARVRSEGAGGEAVGLWDDARGRSWKERACCGEGRDADALVRAYG